MIRPIDIRLNAAHPELPLPEAATYTGSPATVLIRGVPPNCGRWAITAVSVAATYPDNTTTTRAAVQSANGVWVATIPATAASGRTASGLRVLADGVDENGDAVTGYVLGVADFAVWVMGVAPAPDPGGTCYQMRYFETTPNPAKKGDVAKVDGVFKMYTGTEWEALGSADLSNYKQKQTPVSDPSAEGVALEAFAITGITQDADGVITPVKTYLPTAAPTEHQGGQAGLMSAADKSKLDAVTVLTAAQRAKIAAVSEATAFDAAKVGGYAAGDAVVYEGVLYTFNAAHTGAWTGTDAEAVDVVALIQALQASKANDNAVVKLTGDQTVAGAKTFTGAGTFNNGMTVYGGALVEGSLSVSFGPNYGDGGWNITKDADGNLVLGIFAGDNSGTLTLPFSTGTLALVSQIPDVTARLQQIAAFPAFDAEASYAVGDKVTYQGQIYECTTAHSGAWAAGDFTVRTLGYLLGLKQTKITASGMLKGDGDGDVTPAVAGTDYAGMGNLPYDIGTPIVINTASSETVEGETVYYGVATLVNRTANIVQVTAATALDELRITFPAAASGKVLDFGLRVEIGTGSAALAAPALVPVAPTGETIKIENADKTIPELADGTATAKGVTLLYFSENAPGVFVVKGEQVEEVA